MAAVLPGDCRPAWWLPSCLEVAVLSGGRHPASFSQQQPQFLGQELMASAGPRGPHVLLSQVAGVCLQLNGQCGLGVAGADTHPVD